MMPLCACRIIKLICQMLLTLSQGMVKRKKLMNLDYQQFPREISDFCKERGGFATK